MEISQIIPHVEALIFAADRPLPLLEIVDLLNNALAFLEDRTNLDQVEAAMEAIREKYSSEFYAFEVRSSGGGYQFLTKKEYYQTVAQLNGDKFLKRLSTAALETLAIIAYRQPISKGEIEYIRGVSTDYSIQKLLEKELIVITGRSEDQPGKPLLYAVSRSFMDYFGLASVADLPKLKELFDEEIVQPTLISDETATLGRGEHSQQSNTEGIHSLMVSEDGELLDPDHQLDHIAAAPPEDEHPASEDEEVEPDDEIVRLDDFIEEANEELENNDEETGSAEITDIPAPEPEAAPDEEITDRESNEDPDGIMEDAISHMPDTTTNIPAAEEEADKKEETGETPEEDDGLEEFDNSFEERLFGEKLLQVNGPDAGNEEEDEDEEEEEDEDDDDDWDDEDDDGDEEDDEEDDDESTDPGDRRK
ncbi:SMC-Scp complex subunit ScpB [Chitinophaga polysaccharea]|uniref:SMC-Scp complex subunit ScpB n=1 Tax=Chitinophaga polysaccharea TaxID=1293035 RepID=UPI00145528B2|nr:SMC-Scp complex subunit ScpB [Chitinophaga polysaccharea]NLR56494.1 SMC-Scp complex subunit ScpB [Chitinophaga polysaccharea]